MHKQAARYCFISQTLHILLPSFSLLSLSLFSPSFLSLLFLLFFTLISPLSLSVFSLLFLCSLFLSLSLLSLLSLSLLSFLSLFPLSFFLALLSSSVSTETLPSFWEGGGEENTKRCKWAPDVANGTLSQISRGTPVLIDTKKEGDSRDTSQVVAWIIYLKYTDFVPSLLKATWNDVCKSKTDAKADYKTHPTFIYGQIVRWIAYGFIIKIIGMQKCIS